MASKQKTKIGHMACLCCGERIPVKAAENGTLNVSCPECDFSAYVKAGTDAHRIVSKSVKLSQAPTQEPPQAPAQAPAQVVKPAPAPKATPAHPQAPAQAPAQVRRGASIFHMGA